MKMRALRSLLALVLSLISLQIIAPPLAEAATTYSFTTAGATGRSGPTQTQINSAYTGTTLAGAVTINTQGIQEWVVPGSGRYQIIAAGAAGGKGTAGGIAAGKGVVQTIEINLTAGTNLKLIVGQAGAIGTYVSGGGGGSFIYINSSDTYPIIASGGGGGGGYSGSSYPAGIDASTSQSGANGNGQPSGGATGGNGGTKPSGASSSGGGGAGWIGNGVIATGSSCGITPIVAVAVNTTAVGGQTNGADGAVGGFGGGGASGVMCGASGAGGGGGYSGGGPGSTVGTYGGGGGGGSYYSASSTFVSAVASNTGNGYITITSLGPSLTSFTPRLAITNLTTIDYDITFSENVTGLAAADFSVSGTGSSSCTIGSPSGSGATYTISLIGCSVGNVSLSIASNAVQNATPQYAPSSITAAPTVVIDQTAPTIASVSPPANGTYRPSDTPTFTMVFSESVTVFGTPRLELATGALTKYANYVGMSDSKTALFRYTVGTSAGEFDTDGIAINTTMDFNGGRIEDLATNVLAFATFSAPTLTSVLVAQKASAPTITSITPGSGQLVVNFSPGASNGATITSYKYSLNGGTFTAASPIETTTPLTISGLTNGTGYTIRILAVTLVGDGDSSTAVTETPSAISVTGDSTIVLTYGSSGSTGGYSASGGTNTFTWSLGSVISGVTLSGTTVNVANTLNAGTYTQTVRATDGASAVGNKQLTITINKATSTLSIGFAGGGTSTPVGQSVVISITTDRAGSVVFSSGGQVLAPCSSVSVASTTGTCTLPAPNSTGSLTVSAVFTPTSGNYDTSTATFSFSIVNGVSTISLSLAGGVTQTPKGQAIVITAAIDQAGKVTIFVDGKRLPGCINKLASAGNMTCSWKPAVQKQVQLKATLNPTNSIYQSSMSTLNVWVTKRSGTR